MGLSTAWGIEYLNNFNNSEMAGPAYMRTSAGAGETMGPGISYLCMKLSIHGIA